MLAQNARLLVWPPHPSAAEGGGHCAIRASLTLSPSPPHQLLPPRRDQFLPELLECAYGLLRLRYLAAAWQLLQGAASWQAAEAALYLLSAVSLAVKTRVLGDTAGGGGGENGGAASAAVVEDRQQTHALLLALFGRVCSPEGAGGMLGAHPTLAQATCRLVEHYASWFGKAGEEPPLQGAFQLLLRALAIPQVRGPGACMAAGCMQGEACRCPSPAGVSAALLLVSEPVAKHPSASFTPTHPPVLCRPATPRPRAST